MSNILVGVTGGIACYKVPTLCRRLIEKGHSVKVVMTDAARKFVTPLTFETVTQNRVYIDDFMENEDPEMIYHIDLVKWADSIIITPATANTIAKLRAGIADNLLTSLMIAKPENTPLYIVPSMNSVMYESVQNKSNLQALTEYGYKIVDPDVGNLACKDYGVGKMPDPEYLADFLDKELNECSELEGIRFLVSAGATKEFIDPVRYISNRSSGKMGLAFCYNISRKGGNLLLVAPEKSSMEYNHVTVSTTSDMYHAIKENIYDTDILVMAAAPVDFRPEKISENKIKKTNGNLSLNMEKTPDILKNLSGKKSDRQVFVGFAAESENLQNNAAQKLKDKGLDMIVANNISREDIGFDTDENEVCIFFKDGSTVELEKQSKVKLAEKILDYAVEIYKNKSENIK